MLFQWLNGQKHGGNSNAFRLDRNWQLQHALWRRNLNQQVKNIQTNIMAKDGNWCLLWHAQTTNSIPVFQLPPWIHSEEIKTLLDVWDTLMQWNLAFLHVFSMAKWPETWGNFQLELIETDTIWWRNWDKFKLAGFWFGIFNKSSLCLGWKLSLVPHQLIPKRCCPELATWLALPQGKLCHQRMQQ